MGIYLKMTSYSIEVVANARVSQVVEVDANSEEEAIELAKDLAMCYHGDFETSCLDDIDIIETEIIEEWEDL